ncbi:MAG: ABC transporter permease [Planctomycetota bacterium]|nr:ABC transporter permease [Planctomycetota bacterium]
MGILFGAYVLLILAMMLADLFFTSRSEIVKALGSKEIQFSIWLSLKSCTLTTVLSLWVAVPTGYLMSRYRFPGRALVDALLDIPIVLPPLVIGLSLLILFHLPLWEKGRVTGTDGQEVILYHKLNDMVPVAYTKAAVILSQFMVACAFAVRTMRATFDQINPRGEQVALTLGCSRSQAFWNVVLPEARRGVLTAATLAWARSMGEFGPILIFAGATRLKTEVLPTTVFLEMSVGNIQAALAVSLLMVAAAVAVLVLVRLWGRVGELAGPRVV